MAAPPGQFITLQAFYALKEAFAGYALWYIITTNNYSPFRSVDEYL